MQDDREQKRRSRGARSDLPSSFGWSIGFTGLVVAAFTAMSGDQVLVLSIAVGSCLVAGFLFSVGREGRRGAIYVLRFPLVFAVLGVMSAIAAVLGGSSLGDGLNMIAGGDVPIVLFIAAFTEVGYVAGRLLARVPALRGALG